MKKTFGLFFPLPSHGSPRLGTDPRRNVGQGERVQCKVGVAKGREGLDRWTSTAWVLHPVYWKGAGLSSITVEHQHCG